MITARIFSIFVFSCIAIFALLTWIRIMMQMPVLAAFFHIFFFNHQSKVMSSSLDDMLKTDHGFIVSYEYTDKRETSF